MRETLLENLTAVFITECDKNLLQNALSFYYKMRHLLQNASFITKCGGTIMKQHFF